MPSTIGTRREEPVVNRSCHLLANCYGTRGTGLYPGKKSRFSVKFSYKARRLRARLRILSQASECGRVAAVPVKIQFYEHRGCEFRRQAHRTKCTTNCYFFLHGYGSLPSLCTCRDVNYFLLCFPSKASLSKLSGDHGRRSKRFPTRMHDCSTCKRLHHPRTRTSCALLSARHLPTR